MSRFSVRLLGQQLGVLETEEMGYTRGSSSYLNCHDLDFYLDWDTQFWSTNIVEEVDLIWPNPNKSGDHDNSNMMKSPLCSSFPPFLISLIVHIAQRTYTRHAPGTGNDARASSEHLYSKLWKGLTSITDLFQIIDWSGLFWTFCTQDSIGSFMNLSDWHHMSLKFSQHFVIH